MAEHRIIKLFPTPLFIADYEDDLSEEINFIEGLGYREQTGIDNLKSAHTYLLEHKELANLKKFFYQNLKIYVDKIYGSNQELFITQCWANRNPKGTAHTRHIHINSIVSGVFYLRQDRLMPPIIFNKEDKFSFRLYPDPKRRNEYNTDYCSLSCKAGNLILFPSSLWHHVPQNTQQGERLSLSFNTFSDMIGSETELTLLDVKKMIKEKEC